MSAPFSSLAARTPGAAAIRGVALVLVAIGLLAAPLRADEGEDWQDYTYPDARFVIRFPAEPVVSAETYDAIAPDGSGVPVPATVYTRTQGGTRYRVSVAHLAGTPAEHPRALYHAVEALRRTDNVALETRVSMANSSCGYYLGVVEPDGALSFLALFYHTASANLFDIHARVPEDEQELRMAGAVHFQQSLSFLPDPDEDALPAEIAYPENWREYDYLDDGGFAIRFPAPPSVERGSYRTADGIEVPAVRYRVESGDILYKVTAATYWETPADTVDSAEAIDPAIGLIGETGAITSDFTVGLRNGQCGRELTLDGNDGSHSDVTLFFPSSQHRLFILETRRTGSALDAPGEDYALFRKSFRLATPEE